MPQASAVCTLLAGLCELLDAYLLRTFLLFSGISLEELVWCAAGAGGMGDGGWGCVCVRAEGACTSSRLSAPARRHARYVTTRRSCPARAW